jgi:uncharacterized glyoxalase superfamily metalloenzyme YdcJ
MPPQRTTLDGRQHSRRVAPKCAAERQHENADALRVRRLFDYSISLERCSAELNQRRGDGAPQSTVEALVYELRTHGLTALEHPSCLRRLDDVSTAQLREVLARLIKLRPKYPAIADDLLLKLGGLL